MAGQRNRRSWAAWDRETAIRPQVRRDDLVPGDLNDEAYQVRAVNEAGGMGRTTDQEV